MRASKIVLWLNVIALTTTLCIAPAMAADGDLQYEVQPEDSLYLIATRYYGDPTAYIEIFKRNKAALQAAYNTNASSAARTSNPEVQPGNIWPGTRIVLPAELDRGAYKNPDTRLHTPMSRKSAVIIANKPVPVAELSDVLAIQKDTMDATIKHTPPPPPLPGYDPLPKKGAAKREAMPDWYKTPRTDLQKCAQAVCQRFKALCFVDCFGVARSLSDGGVSCPPSPMELPYEAHANPNDTCAEVGK